MRRTYDKLDKDTVGDFGHGWSMQLTDFEVQTNGALGEEGWIATLFCGGNALSHPKLCLDRAPGDEKLAAVTWPDGRVEVFEFTPEDRYLLASVLLAPAFEALGSATSTLAVSEDWPDWEGWVDWGNGRIWNDFDAQGTERYAPELYELTDTFGNVYQIAPALDGDPGGLRKVTDRYGNTIEVTNTGLVVSNGPDVSWTRVEHDRIRRLDLPDGEQITYTYTSNARDGDLASVTWQDDTVDTFTYDSAHRLLDFGLQGQPPLRTV